MKKVFVFALMAVMGLFLVGCVEDTTTVSTTAEQTTAEQTTAEQTTAIETTTETPVDLVALINNLKTQYASTLEDVNFLATENLTLITTAGDLTITYSSSNTMYLEDNGTIHRPSFLTGNQTVVLTASITDGTVTESYGFFVTVKALDKTDQERADEVFLIVTAFPTKEKWTAADAGDIEFLTTAKDLDNVDYTVVWVSSHPENLSVEGVLVQPAIDAADVVVTMTATITIGGVDFTETVLFTIAKLEGATEVSTIAEAAALGEGAYVRILGVTISAIYDNGDVWFTDGVDSLYIYTTPFEAEVGDVLDITGEYAFNFYRPQLISSDAHPVIAVSSTAAVSSQTVIQATSLEDILSGLSQPAEGSIFDYERYEVTVKVCYEESLGKYGVFLVPTDYDFTTPFAVDSITPNGTDYLLMYYHSNIDLLKTLHGKEITLTIQTTGYRSDKFVFYADFFGTAADLSVVFDTDAEAVASALSATTYPAEVIEDTTLVMPAAVYGVIMSYASNNTDIIDPTTGMVDLTGLTTQVEVTVTVTATKGTESDTKDIVIKVGVLPLSTILDAQALAEDTKVKIQGIVTTGEYQNTYMIQDTTGGIAVYTYDATLKAFLAENLGNKVEVIGSMASNGNGMIEIEPEVITFVEASTVPAATNLDAVLEEDFIDYGGMLVEFTDLYVKEAIVDSFGNVVITFERISDGAIVAMRWDSRVDLTTEAEAAIKALVVGDKVTVTSGLGWYKAAQMLYTDTTVLVVGTTYTDAELLAADAARFEAAVTITTDYMLPELLYADGVTASIATELQAYLTDALTATDSLTVALPNGDVTGNVTFTLSLNTETVDVVVAITLDGLTDAEKLVIELADLDIEVAATAQETVVLPLEGDLGAAIAWSITSGTAVLDVDGKTLTFDAATADYDVVLQATLSIGTETPVTKDFTVEVTGYTVVTDFATLYTKTAEAWDVANDVTIYVQGVVTGKGYNALYLADANGVGVKISGNTFGDLAIGDLIIVGGKLEDDNGVRQFDFNPMVVTVLSSGNAVTANVMTADEVIALTVADTGKLITVTNVVLTEVDYYYLFTINGTGETSIDVSTHPDNIPAWFDAIYDEDDTVATFTFIFSKFKTEYLSIEGVTLVATEQNKVDADAAELPETLVINADEVLPLPIFGSTFTVTAVSTEIAAYIDYTSTPGTLIVLSNPAVAAVGTVTIDVMQGTTTVTVVIPVTVDVEPVVVSGTVETFDNFNSVTSYSDGSFVGVDGITWTYVQSRDNAGYPVDGNGMLLRNLESSSSLTSSTISGGISSFNISMVKGFTGGGDRQIKVTITPEVGDAVVTLSIAWDNTDVQTLNIADLAITGNFTITIENVTAKQVVIDSITWE